MNLFSLILCLAIGSHELGLVNSQDIDAFGTQTLYPSDPAKYGHDWESNWSGSLRSVNRSFQADPKDAQTVMRGTGRITFGNDAAICYPPKGPRLYINRKPNEPGFEDVEFTAYALWGADGFETSNAGFTMMARNNHYLYSDDGCQAAGYYMRIWQKHGKVSFQKEYYHGSDGVVYSGGDYVDLFGNDFPKNQWVGMKFVVYTIPGTSDVQLEMYLDMTDGANGGDWQLIHSFIDRPGQWTAKTVVPAQCPVQSGDTVLGPKMSCGLRTDGGEIHWKKATIRHIAPKTTQPTNSPVSAPTPNEWCALGIQSTSVCCGACDGLCGGSGCSGRPGGADECCTGKIKTNAIPCATKTDVGCIIPDGEPYPLTPAPVSSPTETPNKAPTMSPTETPSKAPTSSPSKTPSKTPTTSPTDAPTETPTKFLTMSPSKTPSKAPASSPTKTPSKAPTSSPTDAPTKLPITKAPVQSTPNWCSNGVLSSNGLFCCGPCDGQCGGSGCSQRPGGYTQCCTGSISNSGAVCQTEADIACMVPSSPTTSTPTKAPTTDAPTAAPTNTPTKVPVQSPPTNWCSGGVLSSNDKYCCGPCDGLCGGSGCSRRPGGYSQCCTGSINRSGVVCQTATDTACIVP